MRVLIVGGGVAGLATAIAARDAGLEAVVLERRPAVAQGGGSVLTLAPNGASAAQAIGVLPDLEAAGFPTDENLLVGATGRPLGAVSIGVPLRPGLRGLTLRRADLVAVLAEHARRRGVELRAGAAVTAVDGAAAVLERGGRIEGDVLVGADGVRSRVRRAIDPDAPAPRSTGLTNFGGVTEDPAVVLPSRAWTMVFGRRAFFGAHPTPSGAVVWFVNVPEPPVPAEVRRATGEAAWRARLLDLVRDDAGPAAALIAAGRLELAADPSYDLPRVRRWQDGRAVVVGDAAHAPAPSSGQGASLALEDAVVLARELSAPGTAPAAGLERFERARRRRVRRVAAVGARSSSSTIPGPAGLRMQEAVMRVLFRTVVTELGAAWMTGARW